ncbi:MAG: Stp1/IreP family PP2C-type Ser/Thr phosphatase [Candidatus Ancillula sp.]|jgi:protein phosphatase|nr:Stp1/IreP family PP2C-type Ser/Thr phosphatase [Candidatus Ancillula sp.]
MSLSKLAFNYGVASDVGTVRDSNQDSAFAGKNFLLVADGMGGHAGGDVASTITVTMLSPLDAAANPRGIARNRLTEKEAISLVERSVVQIYLAIIEAVKENDELAGMGTTLTAILRSENAFVCAHLGDSRAYLLHEGKLTQITRDHTFVQHLVDSGKITLEEAMTHPQKNVVMRVLGDFEVDLNPDIKSLPIERGDRYLLCSDGVCGVLDNDEIERILQNTVDVNEAAKKLVDRAMETGSTDNCTAVVADVVSEKELPNHQDVPIFAGAAHESLQDYLNEIVERGKRAAINTEPHVTKSSKRSLFSFFKKRNYNDDKS